MQSQDFYVQNNQTNQKNEGIIQGQPLIKINQVHNPSSDQDNKVQQSDQDFIIMQALSPEQQQKLIQQRLTNLTTFYNTNKKYQISSWYEQLKDFTFYSKKTEMTAMDAYVLYWLYYNDHDIGKLKQVGENQLIWKGYGKLKEKIDNWLQQDRQQNKRLFGRQGKVQCFMKLATRSPKDLGYKYTQHQIQQISIKLTKVLEQLNPKAQLKQITKQLINQIYKFFLSLSKQKFKITSGQDFINIFSHSQRIIIDISDFSEIKGNLFSEFSKNNFEKADEIFIQLWAREWRNFQWYEEFRCFYKDYQLTAISQYDQRCYFKELEGKQKVIRIKIQQFFRKLKPHLQKLKLSEGVMDLVLFGLKDWGYDEKGMENKVLENCQIKLIEINVFNKNSRASLFSWQNDWDILNGNNSQNQNLSQNILNLLTLRILTQQKHISKTQVTRLMGMIQKGTSQIISKSMQTLKLSQQWQQFQ